MHKLAADDLERLGFRLSKFDNQFDLCASVFIFIGLIGTIAGFAQSLSRKTSDFDLAALAHALSTSAFGIIWSILLNVWYSRLQSTRVAPWLEQLRERVAKADPVQELHDAVDSIKQDMADEFRALQRQAFDTFRQTLDAYSTATERLSGAASTMSQASQTAATQYYAVNNEVAESTRRLDAIITRCTGLPEQLANQLEKTFAKADLNLGKSLEAYRFELKKLEDMLGAERQGLARLFEEQSRGIEQIGARSIQASAQAQQNLIQGVDELGTRLKATAAEISEAPAGIVNQVNAIVETYGRLLEQKHEATAKHIERLGERFTAHLDQPLAIAGEKIEELLSRAQKLYTKLVADERKLFRESSEEARREFHQATVEQIAEYRQMVAKIPSGIKAMQVENIEALHKAVAALDECASLLKRHAAALPVHGPEIDPTFVATSSNECSPVPQSHPTAAVDPSEGAFAPTSAATIAGTTNGTPSGSSPASLSVVFDPALGLRPGGEE